MRRALSYAVDKKAIVAAVFKDSGTPANLLLPPGMLGYNDKLPEYAYDPQKARELLKQAGLEQGFETDIWSMPVQRPYNPNSKRIAEMIQSDWAKVGVKAKIVTGSGASIWPGCAKANSRARCTVGCRTTAIRTTSPPCSAAPGYRAAPTWRAGAIRITTA